MPPVNHQQNCLMTGICGIFDVKSNHFGPMIPKNQKVMTYQNFYGLKHCNLSEPIYKFRYKEIETTNKLTYVAM